MLVSVIIPAYNAEDTLKNTLSDVLSQSFTDFEVVIVDDGSKDKTGAICDEYKAIDNRIVVLHQKNGGLSNARNNGIKIARGKYITLVDADDRIEKYYLEYLIKAIQDNNADMSCGRTDRVKENYSPDDEITAFSAELFDRRTALSEMLTGKKITVGPCNRLVPRNWYIESPFLEGKKYEDLSNSYKLHLKSSLVAFVNVPIYHYVMRGGSITGSINVTEKQCMDYYEAINLCADEIGHAYPDLENDIAVLKSRDYMSLYLSIHRCAEISEELLKIELIVLKWVKFNWRKAFTNKKAPINVRLRILLFRISRKLYSFTYYIGIRIKGKALA
ncbi:glycosyltransferase family 2 protein [Butyrivibrio sp. AE2032]|uniref:glycosyltransferase family 2 protein n=1 Tax=Butyrivibrio sp. AE2032 TaxID=1458463 RepID=UPI00054E9B70|nr:glycosyltransferase family 2 protein [Butyrivibrio sp. AE2032]